MTIDAPSLEGARPAPEPLETEDDEDEAEQEALAELRRIGAAHESPPARYVAPPLVPERRYAPAAAPPAQDPIGTSVADAFGVPAAGPSVITDARRPKTLEDLYSLFPNIGDGQTYLRVERKLPKQWQGSFVAGWLDNLTEMLSSEDFQARFGGQRYDISVMGPQRGRAASDGQPRIGRLATLTDLTFPGPPNLSTLPRAEDLDMSAVQGRGQSYAGRPSPMAGAGMPPYVIPQQVPTEVQLAQLRIEREREQEHNQMVTQLANAARPDSSVVESLRQATDKTVAFAEREMAQRLDLLREQNERMLGEIAGLRTQLEGRTNEIVALQHELAETRHRVETEAIREARGRHADEVRALTETHGQEVRRLRDDAERVLREATAAAAREREQLLLVERREVERARDDAQRRDQQLRDSYEAQLRAQKEQFEGRLAQAKENYDSRLGDLERSHRSETEVLRHAHSREVEAIRASESGKATLAEKMAGFDTRAAKDAVSRLESELGSLRAENDRLRGEVNKPVIQAIQEAHQLSKMTGLVEASSASAPAPAAGDGADWKSFVAGGIRDLIQNAPKALAELSAMRQQNMAKQQAAQTPPPEAFGAHAAPPALPPTDPRARRMAPRPAWATPPGSPLPAPSPYTGPVFGPVVGGQGAVPLTGMPFVAAEAAGPPVVSDAFVPMGASPIQPEAAAAAQGQTSQGQATPVTPSFAGANPSPAPKELVAEFVGQLENAIATNFVTAEGFAHAMHGRVGPAQMAELVQRIQPAQFFAMLEQAPGSGASRILTRDGRRYVSAMWVEAQRLVGGASAAAS